MYKRQVKEAAYENLTEILDKFGHRKEVILLGDFNQWTESGKNRKIIGRYGHRKLNDKGERLIETCSQYSLRIQNGFFKHKSTHKYTWVRGQSKSIIDCHNKTANKN